MISSFNHMKAVVGLSLAQSDHSLLAVSACVCTFSKDGVICWHHLLAKNLQVSSLSPVVIPEVGSLLLLSKALLPKLEVWKDPPVKDVVVI